MPVVPANDKVELMRKVVNVAAAGLTAPIDKPLAVPPVIVTASDPCVDIVPKPVISVLGIFVEAIMALVPLPLT